MRRRTLIQSALGSALAAGGLAGRADASSLGGPAPKSDISLSGVTVKLGVPSPLNVVRLDSSGALKNLDFKVELANFAGSVPALEALNAGAVDLMSGGVGNMLAIAGNPGRSVIVGAITNFFWAGILVPGNSKLSKVAELKGKRLAVLRGSGTDFRAAQVLQAAGLAWTDIQPVNLGPADGLSALMGGSLDAWAMWDPQAAIAEINNGAKVLAELSLPSYNYVCASTAALADPKKEAAIVRTQLADLQSYKWVRDNPDAWTAVAGKTLGLSGEIATRVGRRTPSDGGLFVLIDEKVLADAKATAKFYHDVGLSPTELNPLPAFDGRFNAWLSANAPKL